jgi:hypothetical protein
MGYWVLLITNNRIGLSEFLDKVDEVFSMGDCCNGTRIGVRIELIEAMEQYSMESLLYRGSEIKLGLE